MVSTIASPPFSYRGKFVQIFETKSQIGKKLAVAGFLRQSTALLFIFWIGRKTAPSLMNQTFEGFAQLGASYRGLVFLVCCVL